MLSQSLNMLSTVNEEQNVQNGFIDLGPLDAASSQYDSDYVDDRNTKVNTSVWLYYKSGPDKQAICSLCRKNVSHEHSIANLITHLRLRHISAYSKYSTKSGLRDRSPSSGDEMQDEQNGAVWLFYEKGPNKHAICNLCKQTVSFVTTNMNLKKHLKERHVSAYMTLLAKSTSFQCDSSNSETFDTNQIRYQLSSPSGDSQSDDDIGLPPKSKGLTNKMYSPIWHFFEIMPDYRGTCNICNISVSYKSTITNLKSHLKAKHPVAFRKFMEACFKRKARRFRDNNLVNNVQMDIKPSTSYDVFADLRPFKPLFTSKLTRINECLLDLFINDLQSFRILDDTGFQQLIHILNPAYELPSKKSIISTMIPALHKKCLEEKTCSVRDRASKVCITIESWMSISDEYYVAVTAHFINDNFESETVLLHCIQFKSPYSNMELGSELSKIINYWGFSDKVSFAIVNDDPNVVEAVDELGWERMSCYCNVLNDVIQESVDLFSETINKVKEIITHFVTNKILSEKLLQLQQSDAHPKKLTSCASSKWNSIIGMLERFCSLQDPLTAAMSDQSSNLPLLTDGEWASIEQLCVVLGPFEEVTRKMNAEKYLSASMAIIITHGLLSICDKLKEEHFFEIIDEIIDKLKAGLLEHFKDIERNENLAICTFLDPRFKMSGFSNHSAAEFTKKRVISMVEMISENDEEITIKEEVIETTLSNKSSVWEELDKAVSNVKTSNSRNEAVKEVGMYLKDEMLDRTKCPLDWWKNHQYLYPNLSKLVIEKCHIVVSSVPCERIFSKKGLEMTDRRSQLPPTRAEEIIFLNCNLK